MAFKIPKRKKQWAEPETDSVVMQSPLSRLQDSTSVAANGWGVANGARGVANRARGVANGAGTNRVHAGNGLTSRDATQRPAVKKDVRSIIRKLLGLDEPMRSGPVTSAANQRCHTTGGETRSSNNAADGSRRGGQSTGTAPTQQPAPNGWRPRRASDRLLSATSEEDSGSTQQRRDSVVSVDSSEQASTDSTGRTSDRPNETSRHTQRPARDPFRWTPSPPSSPPLLSTSTSSPPLLSTSLVPRKTGLSLAARRTLRDTRTSVFSRPGKPAPTEPIVLSSEEEDIEDMEDIECGVKTSKGSEGPRSVQDSSGAVETSSEGSRAVETSSEGSRTVETSSEGSRTVETFAEGGRRVQDDVSTESSPVPPPPPASVGGACPSSSSSSSSSVMELQFSRLLLGQLSAQAHGNVLITEDGINLPLKGPHSDSELAGECLSVAVVTSQLRGYGVWEKGVAAGSHAPSLLFLWVTDSQASLLQTELSVLQPVTAAEGACPFILVELASPLAALQSALLRSLLDMYGTAASRSVSVSVDHALSLTHRHPPLLAALRGHNTAGVSSRLRSRAALCLTTRLIQYPLTPGKGRIAVTTEDLCCLDEGEFLNDVIIDFYLKYLLLECSGIMSERCHVFSSFFYRQLTKRRTTEEEPQPLDRVSRHQRVKTWTRNVDIFDKDFLFVPVNQESHWYLVMVCFPGLVKDHLEETSSCMSTPHEEQEEVKRPRPHEEQEEVKRPRPHEEQEEVKRPRLTRGLRARGQQSITTPPECTRLGWKRETALKRPCILVMDSLKRSCHENVCKLLRDYLCVEWRERRQSSRLFSSESMKSSNCRLPLQDNSSDCGLYLLQYVETFLKNPVVHFDLPVCLENWFPRQQVRKKREEIRKLVMEMHRRQNSDKPV